MNEITISHIKSADMQFTHFSDPPGVSEIVRAVDDRVSSTLGCGLLKLDECSIDWTLEYDEALFVVEGTLVLRVEDGKGTVIRGSTGDIVWIPKGIRLTYEGDRCVVFFCLYPVDWRDRKNAGVGSDSSAADM